MSKKDYQLGIIAGLLIGILVLPVLKTVQPSIFERFAFFIPPFFLIATPLGLAIFYLIGQKIAVLWQIGKFGVVGVLNTLVDWGVLTLLILIFKNNSGIEAKDILIAGITFYSFYKSVSFVAGNINSYFWNKFWTFSANTGKDAKIEWLQFFIISVIGFALNVAISSYVFSLSLFSLNSGQRAMFGAAVGTVVILAWNFLGFKYIVFKSKLLAG